MSDSKELFGRLMRQILDNGWTDVRAVRAIYGFTMREHVNEAHPNDVERVAEMATLPMVVPEERDAWLFGYRYHDTPTPTLESVTCEKASTSH